MQSLKKKDKTRVKATVLHSVSVHRRAEPMSCPASLGKTETLEVSAITPILKIRKVRLSTATEFASGFPANKKRFWFPLSTRLVLLKP